MLTFTSMFHNVVSLNASHIKASILSMLTSSFSRCNFMNYSMEPVLYDSIFKSLSLHDP